MRKHISSYITWNKCKSTFYYSQCLFDKAHMIYLGVHTLIQYVPIKSQTNSQILHRMFDMLSNSAVILQQYNISCMTSSVCMPSLAPYTAKKIYKLVCVQLFALKLTICNWRASHWEHPNWPSLEERRFEFKLSLLYLIWDILTWHCTFL